MESIFAFLWLFFDISYKLCMPVSSYVNNNTQSSNLRIMYKPNLKVCGDMEQALYID